MLSVKQGLLTPSAGSHPMRRGSRTIPPLPCSIEREWPPVSKAAWGRRLWSFGLGEIPLIPFWVSPLRLCFFIPQSWVGLPRWPRLSAALFLLEESLQDVPSLKKLLMKALTLFLDAAESYSKVRGRMRRCTVQVCRWKSAAEVGVPFRDWLA